jgi:hypothetical protein
MVYKQSGRSFSATNNLFNAVVFTHHHHSVFAQHVVARISCESVFDPTRPPSRALLTPHFSPRDLLVVRPPDLVHPPQRYRVIVRSCLPVRRRRWHPMHGYPI